MAGSKCIHNTYGGGGGFMPKNINYIVFGPGGWGVAQIFIYAHWSWQRDAQIFVFAFLWFVNQQDSLTNLFADQVNSPGYY